MNETILILPGFEATIAQILLFLNKMTVLFFSIWLTIIVAFNIGLVSAKESKDALWKLNSNNFWKPALLWTIFWILCQIQL